MARGRFVNRPYDIVIISAARSPSHKKELPKFGSSF